MPLRRRRQAARRPCRRSPPTATGTSECSVRTQLVVSWAMARLGHVVVARILAAAGFDHEKWPKPAVIPNYIP